MLEFGLDKSVHDRKIAINVTPAFIEVIAEIQLPPNQVILDIPDNIVVGARLVDKLKQLRAMGYGLSVGGLANLKNGRLLPIASIFRIDVQKVTREKR